MPRRNVLKGSPALNTTFHVYNRGIDRRPIFKDDSDRREFLQCFRRYLSPGGFRDGCGRPYLNLVGEIEVISYCLMPNHFHLVIHQFEAGSMTALMRGAINGYVRYFNRRHGRSGALFAGPYRAAPKHDPHQIQTAIAYVHLNHPDGATYKFSTHNAYTGATEPPDWVNIKTGLAVFGNQARYERFITEYAQGV